MAETSREFKITDSEKNHWLSKTRNVFAFVLPDPIKSKDLWYDYILPENKDSDKADIGKE